MRLATALFGVLVVLARATHAAAAPSEVQIRNNVFAPVDVRVPHGQSVRWRLAEGRHTVTSDRKGFDSGELKSAGQTFTFVAPRADITIYYHCRVHGFAGDGGDWGSGMVGRIVVGAGSLERRSASDVEVRRVPSRAWPTLDGSLRGLKRDRKYLVELGRGTYGSRDLTAASLGFRAAPSARFELTLRGAGTRPTDVVFEGGSSGLGMSVDGLAVENVSFRGQSFAALFVRDTDRWSVDDVIVSKPGRYGVWVENAYHGRIRRVSVSGARVAGISVSSCGECDLLVDSVTVSRNLQGVSALHAGTIVVRGSTFIRNGVGLALKGSTGAHVLVNTFRDNTNREISPPQFGPEKDLPVGAGVWIDGGGFSVVERNDFVGHSFGVVLTGPNVNSRVKGNTLTKSVEADVAWDGVGGNVCFGDNVTPKGEAATAMPTVAQQIYACELPATVGVPYPVVTATVLGWGLGVLES